MELVYEHEYRVTADISGMGGTYEQGCQRMLYLGLQQLDSGRLSDWDAVRVPRGIVGVLRTENAQGVVPAIEAAIHHDEQIRVFGVTGAMHQFVLLHLARIHRLGYREWLDQLDQFNKANGDKDRLFLIKDPPMLPQPGDPRVPPMPEIGDHDAWEAYRRFDTWADLLGWRRR